MSHVSDGPLRIVFAGTPAFALPALEALYRSRHEIVAVYTQPDRPAGRGRPLRSSPVKQQALAWGLTVCEPASLRDTAALEQLAGWQPALMVVVAFGLLLPPAALCVPRLGCWNIHASLLPRWRGAAPVEHAILAGDRRTGVSIMQMDAGLDTGDVLLSRAIPIRDDDTGGSLHDRLAQLGAEVLLEALERRARGTLCATPQDPARVTRAPRLTAADAAVDWARPAAELARQVRALNPRRPAHGQVAGEDLRIWSAQARPASDNARPGQLVAASSVGMDIATGAGVLRVTRVQRPGGRALSAADYLNGRPELRGP